MDFDNRIREMCAKGFTAADQRNCLHLNYKIINEEEVKITLPERLSISRDIVDTFESCKPQLTIPQLKFAINNLDRCV